MVSIPARRRRRLRGVAATELVVMTPFLCLLCLATVDLGRYAHTYIVLCNASRVGAEQGALKRFTNLNYATWQDRVIEAAVEELAHIPGYRAADGTVDVETTADTRDTQHIQVTVSYPFRPLLRWPMADPVINLQGQSHVRQYR